MGGRGTYLPPINPPKDVCVRARVDRLRLPFFSAEICAQLHGFRLLIGAASRIQRLPVGKREPRMNTNRHGFIFGGEVRARTRIDRLRSRFSARKYVRSFTASGS